MCNNDNDENKNYNVYQYSPTQVYGFCCTPRRPKSRDAIPRVPPLGVKPGKTGRRVRLCNGNRVDYVQCLSCAALR